MDERGDRHRERLVSRGIGREVYVHFVEVYWAVLGLVEVYWAVLGLVEYQKGIVFGQEIHYDLFFSFYFRNFGYWH
ncbi:unnamed protein product, partial [Mesorhabditis spiculigera]